MLILRILLRSLLAIARLCLALVKKSVKLTLITATAAALLMVLDTLLLEADNDRPGGS